MDVAILEHFVAELTQRVDETMKFPLVVCAIASNGSVLATRINEGGGPETLTQHLEDHGFKTPINIMIVGHDGGATRLVLTVSDVSQH
ncbi:hypothetical protein L6654_36900 [Bradyrhizobium sp. WYCCWR 13023]|uniref:Uncharacterized protein n=1 Tax=Bradyrhizobium zhengyangense TaxID=2911009 RepID=A0A9X1RL30_9BRAD|nr:MULTISPECIES: hypothetical protein [Bradyrhizobium]MCG2632200.1 hypothetical protein [Bradyrhizobium zhengyangense]MCG2673013.1 hypothetical protein [Bradyrhizobium zhengyangense]